MARARVLFADADRRYVSRSYSLARRSLSRNREILQPVINERKLMMQKWGDDWTDKPVGLSFTTSVSLITTSNFRRRTTCCNGL